MGESGHMDHVFGRAKVPQSISNCWALCLPCDTRKTLNQPSAYFWLKRFMVHAAKHGYDAEMQRAMGKMYALIAKGRAKSHALAESLNE